MGFVTELNDFEISCALHDMRELRSKKDYVQADKLRGHLEENHIKVRIGKDRVIGEYYEKEILPNGVSGGLFRTISL